MRLVTVEEMIALEIKANKNGLSYEQMMRNAGNSLAKIVMDRYGYLDNKTVLGLIGSGNNGGDTLIALLALQNYGWQTTAYIAKERKEDDGFISELIGLGATIYEARLDPSLSDLKKLAYENKVVLDGVLGTGIKLPLKGKIPEILNAVNDFNNNAIIVAVDCPSGTECESGKVDPSTLKADITVCMAALKGE